MLKSFLLLCLMLITILSFLAFPCAASGISYNGKVIPLGDAVGDSVINIKDLVRVKKYIVYDNIDITPAADYNDDGVINTQDLILIKKELLNVEVTVEESPDWSKNYY